MYQKSATGGEKKERMMMMRICYREEEIELYTYADYSFFAPFSCIDTEGWQRYLFTDNYNNQY